MKIGFDAKRAFANHSGLGVYSREVILGLTRLFSAENLILFTPKKKIWTTPLHTVTSSLGALWRSCLIYFDIKKLKIEVYHGLAGELPLIIPTCTKTVVTIHDLLFLHFPQDYPWLDRTIYHWKARYACKNADVIVAISEVTKLDIMRYYCVPAHKIKVIPVPIPDINYSLASKPHSRDYALCISSFIGRKNQSLVIEAFLDIADRVSYDLIFIGSGKLLEKSKKKAQSSAYSHRIFFLTGLTDIEKYNYLDHSLFTIYPSMGEGFGIPILESFLFQKIVLLSDTPIHREVAGAAGIYFQNNSKKELAEKMEWIVNENKKLDLNISTAQLRKYDTLDSIQNLADIYQSLIGRTPMT